MIEVSKVYRDGKFLKDISPEEISDTLGMEQNQFIWIGIRNPNKDCIKELERTFQLHEMLIEDALEHRQYPKIERYENYAFLALNTAEFNFGTVAFGQLKLILFKRGLISLLQGSSLNYLSIQERCHQFSHFKPLSISIIFYYLIDQIIDDLIKVTAHVHGVFEQIEERFISQRILKDPQIFGLYLLRRDLLQIQSTLIPLVEITERLQAGDNEYINQTSHPYFRDLYFNSAQVGEDIRNLVEKISYAFEAAAVIADSRENMIQKKLGSWAAILAVPALVSAIYGMNFAFMPELQWEYGYYTMLLGCALICSFLYIRFRQINWL
ncbi:MAG: CorA family divalent cation transporter [Synechococcales bacterium]|nr:CorA family divalent cation transporter [Synechococcales bacterium]